MSMQANPESAVVPIRPGRMLSSVTLWAANSITKILAHRRIATVLAITAAAMMLPSLRLGLIADDLPQRAVELRPDQLPARMSETGNPADSGKISTVLFDLFGLNRNPHSVAVMKDYGTLPWWTPDDLKCSLCRPVAAFTHWIDYRLFPDSPALMHAHNIAWFAAVVFATATVYRKIMGPGWAAGLAAVLFLLDANTYLPAAFVANRGYFLGLFFGMLCVCEHLQWRSAASWPAMLLSALFLALSLLSEESGASTFAFLLAYALVLETGGVRNRALTLLPSVLVITAWWILYQYAGYGLKHVGLYIDPAREPLGFLRALVPRDMLLLGSQLSGVPPETLFVVKPSLYPAVVAVYGAFAIGILSIILPWVRRDKTIAFWFAALILAAIPEAVLVPLSKNLGYLAIGAFGLIGSFVAGVASRPKWFLERRACKVLASAACVLLILIHGPGAIAKRIVIVEVLAPVFAWASPASLAPRHLGNENVIIINHPVPLESVYAPGYEAYEHQQLPKTSRVLTLACTSFEVQRTDDETLVIQSHGPNFFSCGDLGAVNMCYALGLFNGVLNREPAYQAAVPYHFKGLTVVILKLDGSGLPSCVAFHFDRPLESPDFRWFWFDWRRTSTEPFKLPAIGQSVTLPGPEKPMFALP